ncbi:MAG: FecR domain-containing protein, partial [Lachnospiraceae bacterium]|nr:FecR domain-containing protein [Lachnospiraceae bacterium]
MKKKPLIAAVSAIVLIAVIAIIFALRGRMTASTMRINQIEGTVTLTDANGKDQTPTVGKRLQDGNILATQESSKAVVELDEDRCVYILELSKAGFHKTGKSMKLTMEEGSTFFYIAEKLAGDESFEIETSTMVIGIRGTSGYVLASKDGPEAVTITSGTVSVYCSKTDETFEVSAGQKLAVFQTDGEWIAEFREIGAWGLPSGVMDIILSDGDLLEEVATETGWAEEVS